MPPKVGTLDLAKLLLQKSTNKFSIMTHSRMGQYFFSYLLTLEVDLIEFLEVMAQIWQYVIFLSLKPIKVTSDFILN